jgi:hypothetical protein
MSVYFKALRKLQVALFVLTWRYNIFWRFLKITRYTLRISKVRSAGRMLASNILIFNFFSTFQYEQSIDLCIVRLCFESVVGQSSPTRKLSIFWSRGLCECVWRPLVGVVSDHADELEHVIWEDLSRGRYTFPSQAPVL